jgi:lipoprotein-anchoring transpeptidase ErfK/SrfK
MRKKKIAVFVLLPVLLIIFVTAGFTIYKVATVKPPKMEVDKAREAIAQAKNTHAEKYANQKLAQAEKYYNDALNEWKLQNEKWFVFRNFSKTVELAKLSLEYSTNAKHSAKAEKNNAKTQLERELLKSKNQIVRFEKYYKKFPLGREIFNAYNKGKLAYLEAENNFKKGDYQNGLELSKKSAVKLDQAEKAATKILNSFFEDLPVWEKNAQLAVQLSKKGQVVILVNKMESTLSVLKAGKTVKVYEAEFGKNWIGDKMMKGDRATPEGIYKVTEKKRGIKTKYHKALLINYPNAEDETRFAKLQKTGVISRKSQIGGLIEIHGGGGKGVHWTDGCVALNNKDMDAVYDMCPVAGPVIIIGADKPLEEYLK